MFIVVTSMEDFCEFVINADHIQTVVRGPNEGDSVIVMTDGEDHRVVEHINDLIVMLDAKLRPPPKAAI